MKKILILFITLIALAFTSQGQKVNKSFTDTSVDGDTVLFEMTRLVELTKGVVIYDFTTVDVADSLAFARIEGSNDNLNWFPLIDNAAIVSTSTDGAKQVYQVDNLRHLYYKLALGAATGDTVTVSNVRVIFKEE